VVQDAAGLDLVRRRATTASAVVVCERLAGIDAHLPWPVLTPAEPWGPLETCEAVLLELYRAAQVRLHRLAHYMDLTARALVEGAGPARLLTRVAADMRAQVELYEGYREETWPSALRARAPQLRQLVTGTGPGSVRATVHGRHLQVWPVGTAVPRGLLVAMRREPWTGQDQLELQQVANLAAGLLREESISQRERELQAAVRAARTAAFQYLMVGDVVAAERSLEPLVPGLVGAVAVQVAVAEVAPGESRETLTKEIEAALGSARALTVLCPVDDGQVIIVWDGSQGRVQRPLEAVAQAVQGRAVGVSGLGPLAHTARLYDAAAVSVEAARRMPARIAAHDGRPPLPELLDASARAWARELLMRLDQVDGLTWQDKRELLDVCRTGLAMGAAGAARLTGQHRQTITARLDELARSIGLDRTLIQHRVAMDLALQLAELPPPPPGTTPAADIVEVLDQDAAREWGHAVLTGLPPRLLTAVAAWVRHGLNNLAGAQELGISRNSMGEWLAEASGYVHLPLSKDRPGAAHQLVWALHVTGRVRLTSLSGDAGGRTASPPEPGVPTMELRTDVAQPARMYDYFLGGRTNYAADRKAADAVLESMPTAPAAAKANRFFMHRASRWLASEAGMSQFLDVGTGIPTEPNLHQVVQDVTPTSRVVYVDNDPIVLAHAQTLLTSHPRGRTAYLQADAREPGTILTSETVRETLDLSQPVAVSLVALLHFVDDQETAKEIVSRLTGSLAPGSYLVLSHGTPDFDPEGMQKVMDRYRENGLPLRYRTREEILDLFGGLMIIEPGLQPVHRWRPERPERDLAADDGRAGSWGAIARI
jgi:hypothetical protein